MAEAEPELLTQRGYARHRGVSHVAVAKAIKTCRLKDSLVMKGKRRLIDAARADAEWDAKTDPAQAAHASRARKASKKSAAKKSRKKAASKKKRAAKKRAEAVEVPPEPDPDDPPEDYFLAKSRRESALADLAELDRDEKEGQLVLADEQRRDGFSLGRILRDAILNVPGRIDGQLAAETDPLSCNAIMTQELVDALRALVKLERDKLEGEGAA